MIKQLQSNKILVFDGAMGSEIIKSGSSAPCHEYLNISQPEIISKIHERYLIVGASVIETNTFGAAAHVLNEHGLSDKTRQINLAAARLARKIAQKYSTSKHPRFIAGSIGPGSKLPSLGQISFSDLKKSYQPQIEGLLSGGVDCFIVETSQDILQLKIAILAIIEALEKNKLSRPIIAQVTIDQNKRTLTGSDMTAVLATLQSWPIAAIGLNCGLGPDQMFETVQYLHKNSPKLVSVMPNAGLPYLEKGKAVYKLSPENFSKQMKEIAENIGVNIVGGCCGTTPEHIKLLVDAVENIPARKIVKNFQPKLSSLFQAQEIKVLPKPLLVGERANANGSKKFRQLLLENNYQGACELAISQEREGAHVLDLSVAVVGRDEKKDMQILVKQLNSRTNLPLMIDSTDPEVIETALQNISGRAVINSINLEDGGIKAKKILQLCRRYQALVVALAIDEKGMALTKARKISVIKRLISLAKKFGLNEKEIFVDVLTFTLGSGEEKSKNAGLETLAAIKEIKKRWPDVNAILGISNISYGLSPASRKFLNSVFLKKAIDNGLDAAILHSEKIISLHSLPKKILELADNLINNRFSKNQSPLEQYINYFNNYKIEPAKNIAKIINPEDKLKYCIIEGLGDSITKILEDVLKKNKPLDIINNFLLPSMDKVGSLFQSGQKQLPFVLRSAEVMREAMNYLQPLLGKQAQNKGTIVLATVRGDIHDIGKNLVDIIFSANGYRVINLGVKQSVENIVAAVKKYKPQAIGLSGLLVESVKAMSEYLQYFNNLKLSIPVICGGAALRPEYLQTTMKPLYRGNVYYAKDALDGLKVMNKIVSSKININGFKKIIKKKKIKKSDILKIPSLKTNSIIIKKIPIASVFNLVNQHDLFLNRWQMKEGKQVNRIYQEIRQMSLRKKLWQPQAIYKIFSAKIRNNKIIIFRENSKQVVEEINFSKTIGKIFLKKLPGETKVGLQLVTSGSKVKKATTALAHHGQIEKQFLLHGLAAEFTEALAVWCNKIVAKQMGTRNSWRFSPGYPIWPELKEQKKIFTLLQPRRINVNLSGNLQMIPEYTTSAIIFIKP